MVECNGTPIPWRDMIEVAGLTRRYKDKLAVDDLSFRVEPGEVTGLLGPNGAGKSTTMRMIAGLDRPTAGTAHVDGAPFRDCASPMATLGALLDPTAVHRGRTGRTHLRALAASNGIRDERVDRVLEMTGMTDAAHHRISTYSLGMQQRIGIAAALLGEPTHLMLDEPVNGLDPDGVHWVRQLVRELASTGCTVLISSHLMSEMSLTADRVIVIGRGRFIRDGSVAEVIASATRSSVIVRTPQPAAARRGGIGARGTGRDRPGRFARRVQRRRRRDRRPRGCSRHPAARTHTAHGLARRRLPRTDRRCAGLPIGCRRRGGGGMTTTQSTSPVSGVTLGRVFRSEVIKMNGLRSTWWLIGSAVVVPIVVTLIWTISHSDASAESVLATATPSSFATLVVLVLIGVLIATADAENHAAIQTYTVVPQRLLVVTAKFVLAFAISAAIAILTTFVTFAVADLLLGGGTDVWTPDSSARSPGDRVVRDLRHAHRPCSGAPREVDDRSRRHRLRLLLHRAADPGDSCRSTR